LLKAYVYLKGKGSKLRKEQEKGALTHLLYIALQGLMISLVRNQGAEPHARALDFTALTRSPPDLAL